MRFDLVMYEHAIGQTHVPSALHLLKVALICSAIMMGMLGD